MRETGVSAAKDVEARDGRFFALGSWPWLRCEIDARRLAGRWVRLTFASGLLDPLRRPVLRIFAGDRREHEILPAALFGRGMWIGRIPDAATKIWISPTNQPGAFSFRIERWDVIGRARLLADIAAADPWRAAKFLWASAIGREKFARLQARRALGATPLQAYDSWRAARLRALDPRFDLPASGAADISQFHCIASENGADVEALKDDDFWIPLRASDQLSDHALAVLASAAARDADVDVLYADEDRVDASGRRCEPRFKPDESPIFQAAKPYLGAPTAIKVRWAKRFLMGRPEPDLADRLIAGLARDPDAKVSHVRRVLLTRPRSERKRPPAVPAQAPPPVPRSRACVIIPTRDHVELLKNCVASLRARAAGPDIEIIVVDNGSVEERTREYLVQWAREPGCRVLSSPGPFNYSALCNLAARETRAPFLLFLNDDVEILVDGWLARLLTLAARPDVGAVGALLLYPDGAIQHAGVALGIDGRAGHFQRRLKADAEGYFGSLQVPHEVSAVTGACLAVEARKFEAVGGFDEAHLPVESNDVDLCLRLAERGWKTVLEPRARATHHESASRGANRLLDERYAAEIAYFEQRWAGVLRDDPYFHPALSLESLDAALG